MTESPEPAVRCGATERSHPEIGQRAARIAGGLHLLGVRAGDRVAFVLRNDIAYIELTVAARLLGAVSVPVNWHFQRDDLRHVIVDSDAAVLFVHSDLLPQLEQVRPPSAHVVEVPSSPGPAAREAVSGRHPVLDDWLAAHEPWSEPAPQAPMAMIYTSGTTGRPKGIRRNPQSREQRAARLSTPIGRFRMEPGTRTLIPAPLYHAAPNTHMEVAVLLGADLTVMPRFDPEEFLRLVAEQRIQHVQMVPTMFVRLLRLPAQVRERYDVSSLETVIHAAAPCPVHVKRAMIDWWGPVISEYYGGSETGMVTWCDTAEWLAHPGTVGAALPTAGVRVVGPSGEALPAGNVGDVYLRPVKAAPEFTYHGDDAKRRAMERPESPGHLTIGDVGYLDEDGYLFLTDRRNDMVISGGVNIYPAEIEACLLELDDVRDAAVLGVGDDEFGERVVAHVELSPGAHLEVADIQAHVRDRLAGYKVPKEVRFAERLPRDDSGKLFKRRLREEHRSGAAR